MTLKPIKRSKPVRRRLTVYDLEWYPHTLELRMIGVYDERGYRYYTTVPDFLNSELTRASRGRWFYAHAGGLFDLRFILEYLADNPRAGIRVSASFSGSSAIIVKIQHGRNTWWFVDSYWLIRQPLWKVGTWIGKAKGGKEDKTGPPCKKGQLRADGTTETECTCDPVFFAPMAELAEYNERDCEILFDAIQFMQDVLVELGGRLEKTIASSAMSLFRRAYLSRTIETSDAVNTAARAAYIASRVEVFAKRCDAADYYDINSSFPYAMTFDAPGNLIGENEGSRPTDTDLYLAEATVWIPDTHLPPLPYRSDRRRLYFPTGSWRSWFTGHDLELVEREGGRVENVGQVLVFEAIDDLRGYAEDIYERRRKAESEALSQVLKILLNSLYGKFAEGEIKQSLLLNPVSTVCPHPGPNGFPAHDSDGVGNSCFQYLSAGVWTFTDTKTPPHAHVPISAHIVSVARRVLYDFMAQAPDVYYCDTDGFATTPEARFDTTDALGGLKHEAKVREGHFLAPKLYAMAVEQPDGSAAWKVRAKGFGGGVSYEQFTELVDRAEDDAWPGIQQTKFERVKEGFVRGRTAPREYAQPKRYRAQSSERASGGRLLTKRRFYGDGSSRPWSVDEIRERGG